MMTPPELDSLKSMTRIAKIIVLIFVVIELLVGILGLVVAAALGFIGFGAFFLIGFVIQLIIYLQIGAIQALVDQGQYQRAKEKTLIWAILGIIFGLIPGIFLILAYLKYDPVITWQRSMGQPPQAQPMWGQPSQPAQGWSTAPAAAPMASPPPAAAAPPPVAPAATATPTCPRCGRPATWIAQYSRWYCYTDSQYL